MISVIVSMLSGILIGYLLRKKSLRFIQPAITLFIWLLLLLLGIEVGSNERIVCNLHTLGVEAIILTLGGVLSSVTAAKLLWKFIRTKQKEQNEDTHNSSPESEKKYPLQGSLIIIGFFATGVIIGILRLLPFDVGESGLSFYALYCLMVSVGISIGSDPLMLKRFRSLNPLLVFLPLLTIIGTLLGTLLVAVCMDNRPLTDYLAVGSGFGYYSLSSILISELRGAELGTVALLANISRELITMLGAPLLHKWFGPLAPISSGGATSMDSTLPIITRTCGSRFTVVTIFHGVLVDFSVPFLVTFFCSI